MAHFPSRLRALLVAAMIAVATFASSPARAATDETLARTQWTHLDCSACLAVAAVLGGRMNSTLKKMPGSYQVSHRLERDADARRQDYRTGELRGVEVLDGVCDQGVMRSFLLRTNPRTKVRGFHVKDFEHTRAGHRTALLETAAFPDGYDTTNGWYKAQQPGRLTPVAHYYSRRERLKMGRAFYHTAAQTACAALANAHDDELTEIVRRADWLSEVEEQLCGLGWGEVVANTRAGIRQAQRARAKAERGSAGLPPAEDDNDSDGEEDLWKGLAVPVSGVCSDVEAVKASAELDQRRWFAWSEKRKAARGEGGVAAVKVTAAPQPTGDSVTGAPADTTGDSDL